jgi:iron complex outermembrane receptor protein
VGQRLLVSAGVRVDYSSLHRLEYQPSLRFLYTPDTRQSAWVAASRAVRTPNRFDRDIVADDGTYLIQGLPVNVGFTGTKPFASEVERSLEAGYRRQSGQRWSVDASVFFSYYERLRALEAPLIPTIVFDGQAPRFVATARTNNAGAGHSYGGELWATWRVHPRLQFMPSYSYLEERRWLPTRTAVSQYAWDGHLSSLKHQGTLRSQIDLGPNVQLDLMARARSRDPMWEIPGALLLDARLAWRPLRASELSLTVRDLTNRQVLEGLSEGPTPAIPLRRILILKLTQRF